VSLTRRQVLRAAGTAGLFLPLGWGLGGCAAGNPGSLPKVLPSTAPLPPLFAVPLPRIAQAQAQTQTPGGIARYELPLQEGKAEILPGLKTTIWGYAGRFPGPTIEARVGRPIAVHQRNELPVPIVTHLHGGRTAPDSDGYPTDLVLPSDPRWQNFRPEDPHARLAHGERTYVYEHQQRAATLWYHDHRMDFTGPQVWRGLAGFHIIRDDAEDALPLPRGAREIPLLICDRSFEADGSLRYPSVDPELMRHGVADPYAGGVLGDVMLVNGAPWPELEVDAARYRFRVLNACNARRLTLSLDPKPPGSSGGLVQIGSDGGLLAAPLTHTSVPVAPAERYDLVIDFSRYPVGSTVVLRNTADSGRMGQILRFRITRRAGDDTKIPDTLGEFERLSAAHAVRTRTFRMRNSGGATPWTINGKPYDPGRIDASPAYGTTEVWDLISDLTHPIHLHLVHFQILSRTLRPADHLDGWKDTVDLQAGQTARIVVRFEGYRGRYVFHCHNLEHEDMAMMGNFEVV
jgi:spore coat protein A